MTVFEMVKDKLEGNRLLALRGKNINKVIKEVLPMGDTFWKLIFNDNSFDYLTINSHFEIEESGM